ncbi:MAG TPA: CAP domain-containing protein [Candidatus Saccharimonadaceae bacterium]|nr:CAP domain-containing protein [Candidatus Saccharimonadaceae bacterium]
MKRQTANKTPLKKARQTTKRHLTRVFVPHKSNDYKPHILRPFGLFIVVALALGIPALTNQFSTGSVLGAADSVTPNAIFADTNSVRQAHGLAALTASQQLSTAANDKAHDMITHDYWAHVSPTGVTPWHWFDVVGYDYSAAGENLAKNFDTSAGVMSAWMASPEHRANILDSRYTNVGIAVVHGVENDQPIELVVAEYGEPAAASTLISSASSTVLAATSTPLTPWQRFQVALNSLSPAVVLSIVILLIAVAVALVAHTYRDRIPKHALRMRVYRHHALAKAVGLACLVVIVISMYGGGQI